MGVWNERVSLWSLPWQRNMFVWEKYLCDTLLSELNNTSIQQNKVDGWL